MVKQRGKILFVVSVLVFIVMAYTSFVTNFYSAGWNNGLFWAPILLLFSTSVGIFNGIKQKQRYYTWSSILLTLGNILFLLGPMTIKIL